MRIAGCLLTLALVAACDGGEAPALPADPARAYFPAGGIVDTIDIDAVDRLALRCAELVAPDGKSTPSGPVIANRSPNQIFSPSPPTGPYGGGAFATGDSATLDRPSAAIGAAVQTQSRLLATVSTASIALPDPAAYRRDWQKYRIRLQFGGPSGDAETREIAAPQPPPAS